MAKKIALGVIAVLVLFLGFVATRPSTFHVERSATINAPPDIVFANLNSFAKWDDWSPWSKLDPNMQKTVDGAPEGVGAHYTWTGNDEVGSGAMTITESVPPQKVVMRLEFLKPFKATNVTTWTLVESNGATQITWSMDGENSFLSKFFGLFMDMDKMIGADFEKGLKQLAVVADAQVKERAAQLARETEQKDALARAVQAAQAAATAATAAADAATAAAALANAPR